MTAPREVSKAMAIRPWGKTRPQLGDPLVQGFGGLCDDPMFGLAAVGGLNPQIVFFVGPIQADSGREICCRRVLFHSLISFVRLNTRALMDGKPYRRFVSAGLTGRRKALSIPLHQSTWPGAKVSV
jgi:hypothetical protein